MLTEAEFAIIAREVKTRSGAVLTRETNGAASMRLQPLARREGFSSVSELIAAARIRPDGDRETGCLRQQCHELRGFALTSLTAKIEDRHINRRRSLSAV